jgi:hypothetical protein
VVEFASKIRIRACLQACRISRQRTPGVPPITRLNDPAFLRFGPLPMHDFMLMQGLTFYLPDVQPKPN